MVGFTPFFIGYVIGAKTLFDFDLLYGFVIIACLTSSTFVLNHICDLDIDFGGMNDWGYKFFNIKENQLCPPYPSCVEDYVGNQDISNCPWNERKKEK